ncbi:MAG: hypothetical protein ABI389_10160 [Rhodanobacter sp.]
MTKADQKINNQAEALVKKAQLLMRWGSVFALAAFTVLFLFLLIQTALHDQGFNQVLLQHISATVGVPLAALTALALVLALEHVAGDIEFEAWGLRFKGASGPIIMWVICFCALVAGIKALW